MDAPPLRQRSDEPWVSRHRWGIGLALAALMGSGYFLQRRSSRRRRIDVDRVSDNWLAQREFTAGQHPDD
jgi:hypothetical protein